VHADGLKEEHARPMRASAPRRAPEDAHEYVIPAADRTCAVLQSQEIRKRELCCVV
jgi:hypothetical protein